MVYNKEDGVLLINKKDIIKINISKYIGIGKKEEKRYKDGDIFAIDYKDYFIVASKGIFNSFYIQAHIFKNIDKNYFNIISSGDEYTILKLKKESIDAKK